MINTEKKGNEKMKFWFRKGAAVLLSLSLVVGMMPILGKSVTVKAATGGVKSINLNVDGKIAGIENPSQPENSTTYWSGSYVYFGGYPQSDTTGKTKEPIPWRVLDADATEYSDNHTLFLTSYEILDVAMFHEGSNNKWIQCNLRKWLNSESYTNSSGLYTEGGFLNTAFNQKEQKAIVTSTKAPRGTTPYLNKFLDGESGLSQNGNVDKIFVLDVQEANTLEYGFYPSTSTGGGYNYSRHRGNTDYAQAKQIYSSDSTYWLRSKWQGTGNGVGVVNYGGPLYYQISNTDEPMVGVCPALNVNLDSIAMVKASEEAGLEPVFKAIGETDDNAWMLTFNGGTGFAAQRKDAQEGRVSKVDVSVTNLGTPSEDVTYNQISAMLVADDNTVAAYGKIADVENSAIKVNGQETNDITIKVPEGVEPGTYTLKVFAEELNSDSETAEDVNDYVSNMAEMTVEVEPAQTQKYTVTVDGEGKEEIEEGNTYKLPEDAAYGYFANGKMYASGSEVVVENDMAFTSVNELSVMAEKGAGIRLEGSTGIRFQATAVTDNKEALNSDAITEGTLITANDLYENSPNGTLDLASSYTYLEVKNEGWFDKNANQSEDPDEIGTYCGAVTNIIESNYIREFIARAYVTINYENADAVTYYSDMTNARSITFVAQAVQKAGYPGIANDHRDLIDKFASAK